MFLGEKLTQKYASNEIYVDLVEEMDAVVNRSEFDVLYFSLNSHSFFSKLQNCILVLNFVKVFCPMFNIIL